uniref:Cell division protein FtsL n=1 Tax=Ammonifex degensii TaxID=42838 RepID=A0A7C1JEE8_9THEO
MDKFFKIAIEGRNIRVLLARERLTRPLPQQPRPLPRAKKMRVRAQRLKLFGMVVLAFLCGVAVVFCEARISYIGFCLEEFRKEMALVRMENEALAGAIERLMAPEQLERVAEQKLGMVRPAPGSQIEVTLPIAEERKIASSPAVRGERGRTTHQESLFGAFLEILARRWGGSSS